jgi:rod shape-determining protein MreD
VTAVPRLRIAAVLVLVLVLQTSLLVRLRVHDVHPEALLVLALAAGLVAGPERGAVIGFFAGLVADLFVETPFGLSALTYCLAAFAIGSAFSSVMRSTWWISPLTVLAGSALGVSLFVLVGLLVGQAQLTHDHPVAVVTVVSLTNAALALPLVPLVRWALARPGPEHGYAKTPR